MAGPCSLCAILASRPGNSKDPPHRCGCGTKKVAIEKHAEERKEWVHPRPATGQCLFDCINGLLSQIALPEERFWKEGVLRCRGEANWVPGMRRSALTRGWQAFCLHCGSPESSAKDRRDFHPRRPEFPGAPPESEVQAQDSACERAKPRLSVLYKNLSAPPASPRENDLSLKLRSAYSRTVRAPLRGARGKRAWHLLETITQPGPGNAREIHFPVPSLINPRVDPGLTRRSRRVILH